MEFRKMVIDNPICKTVKETQMYRTVFFDSVGEGKGGMI